jgi:hypothetical protein
LTPKIRRPLLLLGTLLFALAASLSLACSDDDDSSDPSSTDALSAGDKAVFCQDVQKVRDTLINVRNASNPPDGAALQTSTAATQSATDELNKWSRDLQGGNNLIENLDQAVTNLVAVANDPALYNQPGELETKTDAVSSQLDALDRAANC